MVKHDADRIFKVAPSRMIPALQGGLALMAGVAVLAGPFALWAKLVFLLGGLVLAAYYVPQLRRQQCYAQLRFVGGNLLLVFRNGREPQLVTFAGAQRILPWLVELNIRLESGERTRWGIACDTMDPESFRQLKVFVQTRADSLHG
ncbi:MAG TPA: protein YgfX [Marinagarivorans sp.]